MTLGIYGLGREVLDVAKAVNAENSRFEKIVFIDDFDERKDVNGIELFKFDEFSARFSCEEAGIIIAAGEPRIRRLLREKVTEKGYRLTTLIHPQASIGTGCQIRDGIVMCFCAIATSNVNIGENTYIYPFSFLGHDSSVGKDCGFSAGVALGGGSIVGDESYIALNASVKERIFIGSNTIIGMGSVVARDIPDNAVAFGNPARVVRNNDEGRVFRR